MTRQQGSRWGTRLQKAVGGVGEQIPNPPQGAELQLSHTFDSKEVSVAEPGIRSSTRVEYVSYPHVESSKSGFRAGKPLQEKLVERHMTIHFKSTG